MEKQAFIQQVIEGRVTFGNQLASIPAGVGRILATALTEILPDSTSILGGIEASRLHSDGNKWTAPLEWYLVLPGLLLRIQGSITSIERWSQLRLEHDIIALAGVGNIRILVENRDKGGFQTDHGSELEIVHGHGTWTIKSGDRIEPAEIRAFASALLGAMARSSLPFTRARATERGRE